VRRARGHEQDRELVPDPADLAHEGLGPVEHAAEFRPAMRVLEDADPRTIEVEDGLLGAAQDLLGEDRRARREVQLPRTGLLAR
jgi:hypothetical protein